MNIKSQYQTGSSLIEVLIALLVFSVGMLGLAALQLNALQGASDSSQRSQTTWIMQDLAERFRANNNDGPAATYAAGPNCAALPANMCADHFNPALGSKVQAANCTGGQMAAFDRWEAQCSYAAVAAFNTIDGRFTSRDSVSVPIDGLTLTVAAPTTSSLIIRGRWLSRAEATKGAGVTTAQTTDLQVQR